MQYTWQLALVLVPVHSHKTLGLMLYLYITYKCKLCCNDSLASLQTFPSGQLIDGPQNGPAPGPWDIAAQPNQLFQDHEKHFEVPHTASVKMCHNCVGAGMTQCWRCRGRGRVSGHAQVLLHALILSPYHWSSLSSLSWKYMSLENTVKY